MPSRFTNVTFDCDDPRRVSAFWSAVLGEPIDAGADEFFCSIGRSRPDVTPHWLFAKVPEQKLSKNRMHVDLVTDDRPAEVARLVELGAVHVADKQEWGHEWSVLQDVEGNEFCLAERSPSVTSEGEG